MELLKHLDDIISNYLYSLYKDNLFKDTSIFLFSLAFVAVGLLSKILGCGGISKLMGYSWGDAAKIGVGMMTRGEVALIVAQRGLAAGMMGTAYFTAVILLIMISSILTPVVLKFLFDVFPEPHIVE